MKLSIGICILAIAAITSSVQGDTVGLKLLNTDNSGGSINVTYGGSPSNGFTGDEHVGFFTYQLTEGGGATSEIDLICFELDQFTGALGVNETYEVGVPSTGPLGSGPDISPMGTDRSNLLGRLYYLNYGKLSDGADDDDIDKKAFQMAVWEIVHETTLTGDDGLGNSYDLATGNFVVNDDYETDVAIDLAHDWLDGLTTVGTKAVLTAYLSETKQDLLYWNGTDVPSPTALVNVLGLGLMIGFGVIRRRRRQK